MPVTDFECQIARGQIDRYLGGGLLSPTALSGLEEHLAECAECKAIVTERRATLLGKLNGNVPTHAVVSMPKKEENPFIAALRAKLDESSEGEEATPEETPKAKTSPRYAKGAPVSKRAEKESPTPNSNPATKPMLTKPVMLAGLLAIVLVGMNAMSRANGGKGVMGGKAAESFAAESLSSSAPKAVNNQKPARAQSAPATKAPETTQPAAEKTKASATDDETADRPLVETTAVEKATVEKAEVVKSDPKEAVKPIAPQPAAVRPISAKPPVRHPARHKTTARVRRAAPRKRIAHKVSRAPRAGVRVYGLDGHPLQP